jgi:hypothetical protein
MKQSTENGQTIPTLDDALTGMAHVVVHLLQVLSQLRPFQGEAERRGLLVLGPGVNVMIIILGDLSQFLAKKWQFLELFNFFFGLLLLYNLDGFNRKTYVLQNGDDISLGHASRAVKYKC